VSLVKEIIIYIVAAEEKETFCSNQCSLWSIFQTTIYIQKGPYSEFYKYVNSTGRHWQLGVRIPSCSVKTWKDLIASKFDSLLNHMLSYFALEVFPFYLRILIKHYELQLWFLFIFPYHIQLKVLITSYM
jgi:hypothetical protein